MKWCGRELLGHFVARCSTVFRFGAVDLVSSLSLLCLSFLSLPFPFLFFFPPHLPPPPPRPAPPRPARIRMNETTMATMMFHFSQLMQKCKSGKNMRTMWHSKSHSLCGVAAVWLIAYTESPNLHNVRPIFTHPRSGNHWKSGSGCIPSVDDSSVGDSGSGSGCIASVVRCLLCFS